MAVLRPDQSQLTFVGESVPGADPDRIVPNVAYTASSVTYASFFSRTPTINVLQGANGNGTATPSSATPEFNISNSCTPLLAGDTKCYVNNISYFNRGDLVAFDYDPAQTGANTQYHIPDKTALQAIVNCEIRRVEHIEITDTSTRVGSDPAVQRDEGILYFDRPLAFNHYAFDKGTSNGSSGSETMPGDHNQFSWAYGTPGVSHYGNVTLFRESDAESTYAKHKSYINLIPGVYETVDTPDFTPMIEPRYFLGTTANRNFNAVYAGQQAYTGALNGLILTNGFPLRFAIGKDTPIPYGTIPTTPGDYNTARAGGADGTGSFINLGQTEGDGNVPSATPASAYGMGLATGADAKKGDVWIKLSSNNTTGILEVGDYLLIDYTEGLTGNAGTILHDRSQKLYDNILSSTGVATGNKLEIRKIKTFNKARTGADLDEWASTNVATRMEPSPWVELDHPLYYDHVAGGDNNAGFNCRIFGYRTETQDGTVCPNTYVEHYLTEMVDLDTISMHLHMKDSAGSADNDFDRRWVGGKVGAMTLLGEEGGLITCNWDNTTFVDMFHNQARHLGNTRYPDTSVTVETGTFTEGFVKADMPGFAMMNDIGTSDIIFPTTKPYYFSSGSIKFLGATNAAPVEFARIRSFALSINNNLDPRYYIGPRHGDHRGPAELREQRREYAMQCTVALPDTQLTTASDLQNATAIFKELLLEGRYTDQSGGHTGFHIELKFLRGDIDGAPGIEDCIIVRIPGRRPGETLARPNVVTSNEQPATVGYANDVGGGIGQQGAFLRSAPHTIVTEAPFQVQCDFIMRNIDIMIRDREPFYP